MNKESQSQQKVSSSRLKISNLPPSIDESSLLNIARKHGDVTDCRIQFRGAVNRRFAFLGFRDNESASRALSSLDNTYLESFKLKVEFAFTKEDSKPNNTSLAKREDRELDNQRLYVYNLPYSTIEDDLENLFKKFGEIESTKIIKQNERSKGFGFVKFKEEANAMVAMDKLDNQIHFGRILHVKPCFKNPNDSIDKTNQLQTIEQEKSSFKKIKKVKMLENMHKGNNWNSNFLNPNTILDRMSQKYNITKKELLESEQENAAVIQATAEKEILDEVYLFLEASGMDTQVLSSTNIVERSRTCLMVKNLSSGVKKQHLTETFGRFGVVDRIFIPENKAIAIVMYKDAEHAANAFKQLNEFSLQGSPIYLEWAPKGLVKEEQIAQVTEKSDEVDLSITENKKMIYIKNLNFETTEQDIKSEMLSNNISIPLYVKIIRKGTQSKGYGFVEFSEEKDALSMMKKMQGLLLNGHVLKLSLVKNKVETRESTTTEEGQEATDRLIVKNLPFQATQNELKDLLKNLVDFKGLRMPKKNDGTSRGFGFIQFSSKEEAKTAISKLVNIHFYGRKLIFEYSKE